MAGQPERPLIHLDTHVVCWPYEGLVSKLSASARAAIETGRPAVSPMVELEITYLREIGRFRDTSPQVLGAQRDAAREGGIVRAPVEALREDDRAQEMAVLRGRVAPGEPGEAVVERGAQDMGGGVHVVAREAAEGDRGHAPGRVADWTSIW